MPCLGSSSPTCFTIVPFASNHSSNQDPYKARRRLGDGSSDPRIAWAVILFDVSLYLDATDLNFGKVHHAERFTSNARVHRWEQLRLDVDPPFEQHHCERLVVHLDRVHLDSSRHGPLIRDHGFTNRILSVLMISREQVSGTSISIVVLPKIGCCCTRRAGSLKSITWWRAYQKRSVALLPQCPVIPAELNINISTTDWNLGS